MARGRGRGHKGQRRHFTSPEELSEQQKGEKWRQKTDETDSEEDGTGSSDEDSDDDNRGNKGVSGLIQIENPNRLPKKVNKNLTIDGASSSKASVEVNDTEEPQPLSRREREELEKQKAREAYQRLHAQGKTDQARADLARLAIIKQQRKEAAERRDAELKAREADLKAKQSLTNKALGKK